MFATFTKLKEKTKHFMDISLFGSENKENYPTYISKQCCGKKNVDFIGEEVQNIMFLSKISIDSCMIIY